MNYKIALLSTLCLNFFGAIPTECSSKKSSIPSPKLTTTPAYVCFIAQAEAKHAQDKLQASRQKNEATAAKNMSNHNKMTRLEEDKARNLNRSHSKDAMGMHDDCDNNTQKSLLHRYKNFHSNPKSHILPFRK